MLIGVESSNLFGCSEPRAASCTRDVVDRGIRRFRRWGVRTVFVAHWVDNAFAGAALEGGAKGVFINAMERLQTGHYFRTGPCPQAGQGEEVAFSLPLAAVLSGPLPRARPAAPGRRARLSAWAPVQRQGPHEHRRLPGPPADGQPHADRGGPPERASQTACPGDRRGAELPARLEPYGHRRPLDRLRPDASQPNRRLQLRHAGRLGRAGVQGLGIASARGGGAASSASASARTPGASTSFQDRTRMPQRTRCATRSARTTAR